MPLLGCRWGAHLPYIGHWALPRWIHHWVCDAWPVRCQTYGYLPSRRASPPLGRYQIILQLVTEAHGCEYGCYATALVKTAIFFCACSAWRNWCLHTEVTLCHYIRHRYVTDWQVCSLSARHSHGQQSIQQNTTSSSCCRSVCLLLRHQVTTSSLLMTMTNPPKSDAILFGKSQRLKSMSGLTSVKISDSVIHCSDSIMLFILWTLWLSSYGC